MNRNRHDRDDDDDFEDDYQMSDFGDDNEEPLTPCPYCRKPIHEESQVCPHCGSFISEEDAPPAGKPLWIVVGFIAALLAIAVWILAGW